MYVNVCEVVFMKLHCDVMLIFCFLDYVDSAESCEALKILLN